MKKENSMNSFDSKKRTRFVNLILEQVRHSTVFRCGSTVEHWEQIEFRHQQQTRRRLVKIRKFLKHRRQIPSLRSTWLRIESRLSISSSIIFLKFLRENFEVSLWTVFVSTYSIRCISFCRIWKSLSMTERIRRDSSAFRDKISLVSGIIDLNRKTCPNDEIEPTDNRFVVFSSVDALFLFARDDIDWFRRTKEPIENFAHKHFRSDSFSNRFTMSFLLAVTTKLSLRLRFFSPSFDSIRHNERKSFPFLTFSNLFRQFSIDQRVRYFKTICRSSNKFFHSKFNEKKRKMIFSQTSDNDRLRMKISIRMKMFFLLVFVFKSIECNEACTACQPNRIEKNEKIE